MRSRAHFKLKGNTDFVSFVFIHFFLFLHRLDGVKYENGKINVTNKKTGNKPKFYQKKWYVCVSIISFGY